MEGARLAITEIIQLLGCADVSHCLPASEPQAVTAACATSRCWLVAAFVSRPSSINTLMLPAGGYGAPALQGVRPLGSPSQSFHAPHANLIACHAASRAHALFQLLLLYCTTITAGGSGDPRLLMASCQLQPRRHTRPTGSGVVCRAREPHLVQEQCWSVFVVLLVAAPRRCSTAAQQSAQLMSRVNEH